MSDPEQPGIEPGNLVAFDLRALTQFQEAGPFVRVLSDIGTARIVLFAFEAGQRLKEHSTSSQVLLQVLRGRIALTAGDASVEAGAGTLLQLEANVRHSISAKTRAVVVATMTPSPAYHSLDAEIFSKQQPLVARAT
ncbi:MAG TPA: cupin domain-containing protein [Ktedonobacterales bacterium]|jgi:quercetin dioxygenase-like cupin family protein|nr:cupin domain-containing protein [Ktedonobacterales bacterium]